MQRTFHSFQNKIASLIPNRGQRSISVAGRFRLLIGSDDSSPLLHCGVERYVGEQKAVLIESPIWRAVFDSEYSPTLIELQAVRLGAYKRQPLTNCQEPYRSSERASARSGAGRNLFYTNNRYDQ